MTEKAISVAEPGPNDQMLEDAYAPLRGPLFELLIKQNEAYRVLTTPPDELYLQFVEGVGELTQEGANKARRDAVSLRLDAAINLFELACQTKHGLPFTDQSVLQSALGVINDPDIPGFAQRGNGQWPKVNERETEGGTEYIVQLSIPTDLSYPYFGSLVDATLDDALRVPGGSNIAYEFINQYGTTQGHGQSEAVDRFGASGSTVLEGAALSLLGRALFLPADGVSPEIVPELQELRNKVYSQGPFANY